MSEPVIEPVKGNDPPNNPNPNGKGIIFHTDPGGNYKTWKIDLSQKQVELIDFHNDWNAWFDWADSLKKVPSYYFKNVDALDDKDLVYIQSKEPNWGMIIDDERSIYYEASNIYCLFDMSQKTGLDIVNAAGTNLAIQNFNQDTRAALFNGVGVVWRRNEFPYENMTILTGTANKWNHPLNEDQFWTTVPDRFFKTVFQVIKHEDQFKGLVQATFDLPTFTYHTDQTIVKKETPYLLNTYVTINFNHNHKYYPEDQKQILVIHYDSYKSDKAVKFFDPGSLAYKEGHEVYLDAGSKSVKFDPHLVAKSSKITIYAWNGQSPFFGKAELVVK